MNTAETKSRRPLNRSITVGCVIFIVVLCVLLSVANLKIYRNYVYDDYRSYIAELLDFAMAHIDADDLKNCIETGEESRKYKETLLLMDDMMNHFSDIHYFYSVLPLNTEDTGNVMSVLSAERTYDRYVDTEGNLYLGWISDDEFSAESAARFFEIMEGDEIVYFEEKTEWGTDYTGAVPIRDSSGKGIAVLAADVDITFINGIIKDYALVNIGIIAAAGLIFISLFLRWSRRNITAPIRALEQSAAGFVDRCRGQRDIGALSFMAPEMRTENEIKSLSDSIVRMTGEMRTYVSEIIVAEKKAKNMQELANRDTLTGVRNKTAYDDEIKRAQSLIPFGETQIGIAVIDMNFLKKINDSYGHDKGNLAIQKLCAMVCTVFTHSPVFRIGGDEFTVILRGEDYRQYDQLKARFDEEIGRMAADETLKPWERVSASIGAAFYDGSLDDDLNSLFRRADQVMYDEKKRMKAERV